MGLGDTLLKKFYDYRFNRYRERAVAAEAREALLRRDLERALARYHEMLDERNELQRPRSISVLKPLQ